MTFALTLLGTTAACAGGMQAVPPEPQTAVPAVRAPVAAPQPLPSTVVPAWEDPRIHEIVGAVSPERIERDIRALVGFGTRHTMSDTLSQTRGIGAARRWIYNEFQQISDQCGGCLEVMYVSDIVEGDPDSRIKEDVKVVNVVAIQRGTVHPDRYAVIQGHYDSRVSDVMDAVSDAPGANDNASGTAATLEAARVLSRYPVEKSVVYAALAGEEQGLFGGRILAEHARAQNWEIDGVLNNDIVGNIQGQNGVVDNTRVRVFAPGIRPDADESELRRYLYTGGELDVPSRQLARYVDRVADVYFPNLDAQIIYRLDRFGRGSDHTPFFLAGYPAVRITEPNEDYFHQHQDIRVEDGNFYGDVADEVEYPYLAKVTALNAATLASLAWAPPPPEEVTIRGAVRPSATLRWSAVDAPDLLGYRVYWRRPTDANWTESRFVGNVTEYTAENVVIDNYFFAVAAVDREGHESLPVFPMPGR